MKSNGKHNHFISGQRQISSSDANFKIAHLEQIEIKAKQNHSAELLGKEVSSCLHRSILQLNFFIV